MKFAELGLEDKLLEAISYMGFEDTTPVQEKVIPVILENRDLIACAQTGTGKTAAFVLPVLDKLINRKGDTIDTLIIVPTRELAVQIEQQIQGFSYFIPTESIAVYGGGDGNDWETEKAALKNGADIVIATPGKLLSHLKMNNISFKNLRHLVLDEADRMLDMGFIDDIQTIISYLPEKYQTLMFSATMPGSIRVLAQKILRNPVEITLAVSTPAEGVDQKVCFVHEEQKVKVLAHILSQRKEYESIIIFTSTKRKVTDIVRSLNRDGYTSHGISSNLEQSKREEVLRNFRARKIRILIATDVMSRGIDVKEINFVINYDVPSDPEDYVHRVGRTARVNARGEALTLVIPGEAYRLKKIERLIKKKIPVLEIPENIVSHTFSTNRRKKAKQKNSVYRNKRKRNSQNRD